MIKKKTILTILLIVCILNVFSVVFMSGINAYSDDSSEIVMEVNSNRILHAKNIKDKRFMASTTKILTAITIIENCELDKVVTVTKDSVGVEGSSIYLKEGEKLSIKDLLYGLMLRSGNDCAETLALACSGSLIEFADLMNKTAKKIGANNSNFVNPHGLHNDNHYTTAYDLALISCYSMKNETFREIVSTKQIRISNSLENYDRVLINKNKMLKEFEGSNGIKTGYTKKAGRCLVSSCVRNGMELVCVVLNCPPMFERSKSLLTSCYQNYKLYKLVESDNVLGFVENNENENFALCVKNDIVLPLTEQEYNDLEIIYNYPKTIGTVNNEQIVGFVEIYCQKNLIFKEKIYTI